MTFSSRLVLHRHPLAGHAHRVELFLSVLGLPFERVDVDLRRGEQKAQAFLAKNPFGQVPVLEDDDLVLADSNAILVYLAKRYDSERRWLPRDPAHAARVQQWLSIAAGPLVAGPAAARLVKVFGAQLDLERAHGIAEQLFSHLERELAARAYLAGPAPTIADLALYAYTAHAPEGGLSLAPHRAIRAWLSRVEALRGFVPMVKTELAEAVS
jgi:glutathione S-transferase